MALNDRWPRSGGDPSTRFVYVMSKVRTERQDKIEIVNLLILAVLSSAAGFCLVFFLFSPDEGTQERPESALAVAEPIKDVAAPASAPAVETPTSGYAPSGSPGFAQGLPSAQPADQPHDGDALPTVPPGRTPAGIAIDGSAFYLKCWDDVGAEHAGEACDRLRVLEKRFSTRLYVVHKCKTTHAAGVKKGKLSLGLEVNFAEESIRFWNGASSDVAHADRIGTCVRRELARLPLGGFNHKYNRYRMFFTVLFGQTDVTDRAEKKGKPDAKAGQKGRLVDVVKDRVRVRSAPVNGAIIGKISSGNQVKLLRKKSEWCNVITPNNNEGWMICDALRL